LTQFFDTTQGIMIIGAIVALVGVAAGWAIASVPRFSAQRRINSARKAGAARDLAMRAVLALDDFAGACHATAHDSPEFNPADAGDFIFHVDDPTLILPKDVDWSIIDPALADDIIWLPNRLRNTIDALESLELSPPDFSDYFEHRQEDFAKLGLRALDLIDRLCAEYGLPQPERPDYYRPREGLQAKAIEIAGFWSRRRMAQRNTAEQSNVTPLFVGKWNGNSVSIPESDPNV
jgi:hypothetical protein